MKKFEVSIFHVDDEDHDNDLNLHFVHLFSDTMDAADTKKAAVKAWMDSVGVNRRLKLDELNAPDAIRRRENDPEAIAQSVSPTNIGLGDNWFILDLLAEAWLISVEEIQPDS